MKLSSDLVLEFAKLLKSESDTNKETIVYGTVVEIGLEQYVQIDGSEILTPMISTINVSDGQRVTVMIKNHSAIVTGNVTSPAARKEDLTAVERILITAVEEAQEAANSALDSASEASNAAKEASEKVSGVVDAVVEMGRIVEGVDQTISEIEQNANTARENADTALEASKNAAEKVDEQADLVQSAIDAAGEAEEKSDQALESAKEAKAEAAVADGMAREAKADAQIAQEEIDNMGNRIETVRETMIAEYARKTDLSEAEAFMQTQITRNAANISSVAYLTEKIDDTINRSNIVEHLEGAIKWAEITQTQADEARALADEAQANADAVTQLAVEAQTEADIAKSAADEAKALVDNSKIALENAISDLEYVLSREDATEEEIAEARAAVEIAQAAANKAVADSEKANELADKAQSLANKALANAETAQAEANAAVTTMNAAAIIAEQAQEELSITQTALQEAQERLIIAKENADNAVQRVKAAAVAANSAKRTASAAQLIADDAKETADKAAADLIDAEERLEEVMADAEASAEEIAEAQANVEAARTYSEQARSHADAAQESANEAHVNAEIAEAAAAEAQAEADEAQAEAEATNAIVEEAKGVVYGLKERVTYVETRIDQNARKIELAATKTEVIETLGGYYSKEESDVLFEIEGNRIRSEISTIYTSKDEYEVLSARTSILEQTAEGLTLRLEGAEKIATNYLGFVGNGLVIGDLTKETLGKNVLIDSDSVDIRNGETVLATFAADVIKLGLDANSSKVELCGGIGTIEAIDISGSGARNWLSIDASKIYISSDTATTLSSSNASLDSYVGTNVGSDKNGTYSYSYLRSNSYVDTSSAVIDAIVYSKNTYNSHLKMSLIGAFIADNSTVESYIDIYPEVIDIMVGDGKGTLQVSGYVDMSEADITNADITNADIKNADVTNADLGNVTINGTLSITSSGLFNGEQKFSNSTYCPTITDSASGVGCAFKASRGLFNEALIDKLIMTASTAKIPFYKYTGTSGGSMTGLTEVASISNAGLITCAGLNVSGTSTFGRIDASNEYLTGSLYVGGKTTTSDGKTGVAFGSSGNISMQGSSTPTLQFFVGSATSASVKITASSTAFILGNGLSGATTYETNIEAGHTLRLITNGQRVILGKNYFRPNNNGTCTLGEASYRWGAVYSSTAAIQTSDEREKENVIPIGSTVSGDSGVSTYGLRNNQPSVNIHSELFDRLEPVQYNLVGGNGRICYGLVAQKVASAMEELGIGENELDLVHHDYWTDEETGEEKDAYGLAYSNLIALLIHEVQTLKKEVADLKAM